MTHPDSLDKRFDFGIFDQFWDGFPNHLPLMSLMREWNHPDWNLENSLRLVRNILSSHSSEVVLNDLHLLIRGRNWRPHLVFCICLLHISKENQKLYFPRMWELVRNQGSGMIPQLVVTLSLTDEDFDKKGKEILREWHPDQQVKDSDRLDILQALSKNHFEDKGSTAVSWNEKIRDLIQDGYIDVENPLIE